ncbi:MAG: sulfite exporter TauE/SafE family protein [Candidatus Melainabacteria bacterium]|nr:sulfite exporter TauE/SafE family protein [Candidatus Melainabacteria bacterium]
MEIIGTNLVYLVSLVFLVAALYSSVGHGGASGYLAILAFTSFSSHEMSTTALILNVIVSGIAFFSYFRAGHFSFKLILPFLIGSIPLSYLGGTIHITQKIYFLLLSIVLIIAAIRMALPLSQKLKEETSPNFYTALFSGGIIGLVSGIVGIGGGIFLSPLMIFMNWASPKNASAASAFFILVNSISGLLGRLSSGIMDIGSLIPLIIAASVGGLVGAYLGANTFSSLTLRRCLAFTLLIAALKSGFK